MATWEHLVESENTILLYIHPHLPLIIIWFAVATAKDKGRKGDWLQSDLNSPYWPDLCTPPGPWSMQERLWPTPPTNCLRHSPLGELESSTRLIFLFYLRFLTVAAFAFYLLSIFILMHQNTYLAINTILIRNNSHFTFPEPFFIQPAVQIPKSGQSLENNKIN